MRPLESCHNQNNAHFGTTDRKHYRSSNANARSAQPTKHPKHSAQAFPDEEIWFDGVSPALIAASREDQSASTQSLVKPSSFTGPTRRIAIDCEYVGVGYEGKEDALARVSVVNQFGHVLLDTLVRPAERVTDYRTRFSGIRPADLRPGGPARPFHPVHEEVAKLCKGRIVIGHSVGHDLKVLMISHPRRDIRDTARYRPFRALFGGRIPSLRKLTEQVLGVHIQTGEHDSIEDARAAMRLYTSVKRVWESGRKGRQSTVPGGGANLNLKLPGGTEPVPAAALLDPLAEYQSGLPPLDPPSQPSKSDKPKLASARHMCWDKSRNRRCSKKRQRFLQKRRKRGSLASAQL